MCFASVVVYPLPAPLPHQLELEKVENEWARPMESVTVLALADAGCERLMEREELTGPVPWTCCVKSLIERGIPRVVANVRTSTEEMGTQRLEWDSQRRVVPMVRVLEWGDGGWLGKGCKWYGC
jgi:hypothetical protein